MKYVIFTGIALLLSHNLVYSTQNADVTSYHQKHKTEFDRIRNSIRIIVEKLPVLEQDQKDAIIKSEIDSLQQLYSDLSLLNMISSTAKDLESKTPTQGTGLLNAIIKHFALLGRYNSGQTNLSEFFSLRGNTDMFLMFPYTPIGNVANLFTIFADIISNSSKVEISDEYTYMAYIPEPQQVKAKAITFKLQQPLKKFNGEQVDHIFMPIIIGGVDESSNISTAIATAYATDKFIIDYKLNSYAQKLDKQADVESSNLRQENTITEAGEQHAIDMTSQQQDPKQKYTHKKRKSTKQQPTNQKATKQQEKKEDKKRKPTKKPTKQQTPMKKWKPFDSNLTFNFEAWKEITLDTDFRAAKQTGYAYEGFSVDIEDSDTEETMNKKITEALTSLKSFIKENTTKLQAEYKDLLNKREISFSSAIKEIQSNAPLEILKVLYAALRYNLDALQQEETKKPGVITNCYSAVHNNFFDFSVEYHAYDLLSAFIKLDKYWYYGNALAQVLQSLYVRQLSRPDCEASINYVAQKLQEKAKTAGREKEFMLLHNHAQSMAQDEFKRLVEDDETLLGMLTSLWMCKLSDESIAFSAEQSISILYNGAKELHKTDLFDMYNKLAEISARNEVNAQKKIGLPQ